MAPHVSQPLYMLMDLAQTTVKFILHLQWLRKASPIDEYCYFNGMSLCPRSSPPTLQPSHKCGGGGFAEGGGGVLAPVPPVPGGGGGHKASVSDCLPLAAPIGLLPPLILTLCGPERVLVVSTEPPDDLSCLTTPGGRPSRRRGCRPCH